MKLIRVFGKKENHRRYEHPFVFIYRSRNRGPRLPHRHLERRRRRRKVRIQQKQRPRTDDARLRRTQRSTITPLYNTAASVRAPSRRPRACVRRRCSSLQAPKPSSLSRDSCGPARRDAPSSRCHSVERPPQVPSITAEKEKKVYRAHAPAEQKGNGRRKTSLSLAARVLSVDRVLVSHSHGALSRKVQREGNIVAG